MIIYIKMDLALNNLQRLICHKNQQTKLKEYTSTLDASKKKKSFTCPNGYKHNVTSRQGCAWEIIENK